MSITKISFLKQVKKSSHSKRVYKQLKKETKREREDRLRQEKEARQQCESDVKTDQAQSISMDVSGESGSDSDQHPSIPAPESNSEDEDDEPKHTYNKPTFTDILRSGVIPDANMIHMARKRRQAARDRGDEFIPLNEGSREETPNSRLVRDDDNDKSDDDEEERVSFQVSYI